MATSSHNTLEEAITRLNEEGWFSDSKKNEDCGLIFRKEGADCFCIIAISMKSESHWKEICENVDRRKRDNLRPYIDGSFYTQKVIYTILWYLEAV